MNCIEMQETKSRVGDPLLPNEFLLNNRKTKFHYISLLQHFLHSNSLAWWNLLDSVLFSSLIQINHILKSWKIADFNWQSNFLVSEINEAYHINETLFAMKIPMRTLSARSRKQKWSLFQIFVFFFSSDIQAGNRDNIFLRFFVVKSEK